MFLVVYGSDLEDAYPAQRTSGTPSELRVKHGRLSWVTSGQSTPRVRANRGLEILVDGFWCARRAGETPTGNQV